MTNNWLVICQEQNITTQVLQANQHSQWFGLVLTEEDAKLIAQESSRTLKEQMRVEFGPGIAQKIIYEFCNSAYLNPNNFTNSIIRLQEIFYLYKNEMEDEITDDELLHLMKTSVLAIWIIWKTPAYTTLPKQSKPVIRAIKRLMNLVNMPNLTRYNVGIMIYT